MTGTDDDFIRRRIEAAGFRIPEERAADIVHGAWLVLAMARRVHRDFAASEEPSAAVRLPGSRG